MQSERRHELEANSLSRELGTISERVRPYSSAILGVIALLLAVYILTSMWNSYQSTRAKSAWDDYQLALFQGDTEQRTLQRLAASEDHQGTEMQEWAMMGWADRQLRLAASEYLTNRTAAVERINDIIGVYEGYAENASRPEIRNRARLGLGRAFEMKNDLKQARTYYERIDGPLGEIAAQRIKDLETPEAADAAKWLATVELPKTTPPPGPGTPGSRPGFEASTPATDAAATGAATPSMEEILGSLGKEDGAERYSPEGEAAKEGAAEATAADAAASETSKAGETAGQPAATETPAVETPAAESSSTAPTETPTADSASESAPTETPTAETSATDALPTTQTPADEAAKQPAATGTPAEQ